MPPPHLSRPSSASFYCYGSSAGRSFVDDIDVRINIILSTNLFSRQRAFFPFSLSHSWPNAKIFARNRRSLSAQIRTFYFFAASVNTASQLATISRTTERPISERLRQLEHSKAENDVRLQPISALRQSLRVHSSHPCPLISPSDKLDYALSHTSFIFDRFYAVCSHRTASSNLRPLNSCFIRFITDEKWIFRKTTWYSFQCKRQFTMADSNIFYAIFYKCILFLFSCVCVCVRFLQNVNYITDNWQTN